MEVLEEPLIKKYTEEEYFLKEEKSKIKHHFINGKIIEMAGATITHNTIVTNITYLLYHHLIDKNYLVLNSDTKIRIDKIESFVYPDAIVIFEKPNYYKNRKDVIVNPLLIVEVSSPNTKSYDRTNKFSLYKSLPSFKEYVLVYQDLPLIQTSVKTAEKTWVDDEAEGLENSLYLKTIDCTLDLKKVYRNVEFE